jgi:hypothetical protein
MQHLLILKYIFPRLAYPEILVNKKGILNIYFKFYHDPQKSTQQTYF